MSISSKMAEVVTLSNKTFAIWSMSIMCLIYNGSCASGRPADSSGKNFYVGHYTQTFEPNLFIPAMLIGTVDFYHFIRLSLTLTLPRVRKVSAKQNLLASFSRTLLF